MSENIASFIVLLAPATFLVVALVSWFDRGYQPKKTILLSKVSSVISLLAAGLGGFYVAQHGLIESTLVDIQGIGLSIRLDSLSMLMLGMIALLGFIIVKFSIQYLGGDTSQGAFMGRLAATIAAVQMLVLAGNIGLLFIAWLSTSLTLHRLLLFYPERVGAQIAAKKKFIIARLGDACFLIALGLLYYEFGTGNLQAIFEAIQTATPNTHSFLLIESSTVLLALVAILKSAQFPTHGWLIEVMETPTPVSALLHAGILNAGPFLMVRLSPIMDLGTASPVLLVLVGGFTALFASVVLLTQSSVKVVLGYSSAAHMGFMLLVCGLGVYSAAMLHLVAHSFYKAHAFLSSGSVVEAAAAKKITLPKRTGNPLRIALSFVMATGIYAAFALLSGADVFQNPALLAISIILILGMTQIIAPITDSKVKGYSILQGAALAAVVAVSFFVLEALAHRLLSSVLPSESVPTLITLVLTSVVIIVFALTVLLQIYALSLTNSNTTRAIYVHLRNGLYANDLMNQMIGANKQIIKK